MSFTRRKFITNLLGAGTAVAAAPVLAMLPEPIAAVKTDDELFEDYMAALKDLPFDPEAYRNRKLVWTDITGKPKRFPPTPHLYNKL